MIPSRVARFGLDDRPDALHRRIMFHRGPAIGERGGNLGLKPAQMRFGLFGSREFRNDGRKVVHGLKISDIRRNNKPLAPLAY